MENSTSANSLIAADRVQGTSVFNPAGDKLGTVEDVMIDKVSGKAVYAIMSFGGFLGMGEKHLPVPWSSLKYDPLMGAYAVDLSDDELAKAPSYAADKEFDWGDRSQEERLHDYYRARPYWGI
jgi:sporulation protein YlmC with PRC-barrel domain